MDDYSTISFNLSDKKREDSKCQICVLDGFTMMKDDPELFNSFLSLGKKPETYADEILHEYIYRLFAMLLKI